MVQLYDHLNRPIDMAKLRGEQAAPTLTGVRNILSGHPAQGLTPARLARLLREAEDGDATRYLELAEEMEEKDLHYLAVLGTRKRAVSQLDITVEPEDTAQATARQQDGPATPPDSIDNLADQILEDEGWREVMEPVVGPLQGLINDAESLEEIRDRLAEALEEMDTAALANRLAEGMFAARLAGDGGAQIRGDSGEDQA